MFFMLEIGYFSLIPLSIHVAWLLPHYCLHGTHRNTQAATFSGGTTDNSFVFLETAAPAAFIKSTATTGLKASDGLTNDAGDLLLNLICHAGSVSMSINCMRIVYSLSAH